MARLIVAGLEKLIMVALATMVILVFSNVVLRYAFNSGITFSEEVSRFLFVWVVFIGALLTMRDRTHLGVLGLVQRMPPMGKRFCKLISDLITLLCCALLLYGATTLALDNMSNYSPVTQIPLGIVYLSCVICCLGISLMVIHSLFRLLSGRMSDEELFLSHEESIE
ncbi:MAG: TRAP transporter small permease [Rhodocyclaceae bacterium]